MNYQKVVKNVEPSIGSRVVNEEEMYVHDPSRLAHVCLFKSDEEPLIEASDESIYGQAASSIGDLLPLVLPEESDEFSEPEVEEDPLHVKEPRSLANISQDSVIRSSSVQSGTRSKETYDLVVNALKRIEILETRVNGIVESQNRYSVSHWLNRITLAIRLQSWKFFAKVTFPLCLTCTDCAFIIIYADYWRSIVRINTNNPYFKTLQTKN